MAKVGAKTEAFNAFKSGRSGSGYKALESALDDLNTPTVKPDKAEPSQEEQAGREEAQKEERESPKGNSPKKKAAAKKTRKPRVTTQESPPVKTPSNGDARFAKRFQTTRAEGAQYDAASLRFSAAVGSKIDFSKITRTLWQIYLQHEDDIIRNVADGEELGHPGTSDVVGLALLEEEVVELINRGLMLASRRPQNLE